MKVKPVDSDSSENDDQEKLIQPKGHKQPLILQILFSVRLFLIVVMTMLVLVTAVSIWAAAYKVNEDAALESVDIIMQNIKEKVVNYLNNQLDTVKVVTRQLRDDYQHLYYNTSDQSILYMFSKIDQFNVSVVSLCLGEEGYDSLYGFAREGNGDYSYVRKRQDFHLLEKYFSDKMGNIDFSTNLFRVTSPYVVRLRDFYNESLLFFPDFPEGGFGPVVRVGGTGRQSTYYSMQVFDRYLLPQTKKRIGLSKVNLSLDYIAEFLSNIKVLERGYIVLTELGSNFIIGTSLDVPGLNETRIRATDIKTRNAGSLFRKMLSQMSSNQTSDKLSLSSDSNEAFIVSTHSYIFDNLKWRLTLVFDENEIKKGIIMSTYVILGVTVGVTILGIVISSLIGWIVTNPFIKLQQDFKKIELLELDEIKPRNSFFTESNSIYSSLTETVGWLSEFRSYLPDFVFNQLDSKPIPHQDDKSSVADTTEKQSNAMTAHSLSNRSESMRVRNNNPSGLFKLGISPRYCSVMYITIPTLNHSDLRKDFDLLNQYINKVLVAISTLCKTVKADLQIKSHNEFMIIFFEKSSCQTALECCLKISTSLTSLNEVFSKQGRMAISAFTGISSGECLQGNVGSSNQRYHTVLGDVVLRAKKLSYLAQNLELFSIVDQNIYDLNRTSYIYRPVDRYCCENNEIMTVYQLLKKNIVNDDEWFYELEQKKENAKFDQFAEIFSKLFSNQTFYNNDLCSLKNSLYEMKTDRVIEKLLHLIESTTNNDSSAGISYATYHSKIEVDINNFLDYSSPLHPQI